VPPTTLQNKVPDAKFVSAGLSTHFRVASGHPRVFSSYQETVLVNRLLHLERIGMGQTTDQITRAAYSLAKATSLKHPWNGEKNIFGADWFRVLMKMNANMSLMKPEGFSRSLAEESEKEAVAAYFTCERLY
jgi:hypothetical protein